MTSVITNDMLPQEKVSLLYSTYAKAVTKRRLTELSVGHLNRAISWKYVHSLLRNILEVDGFSPDRYKYATAVEPPDEDELRDTKRHQNEAEMSGGILAMVDNQRRLGLLTKNHLLCALLLLLDGRIKKDHDHDSVWTRPKATGTGRHKDLHDALAFGLEVKILDKRIWKLEKEDDILLIRDADNQDNFANCPDSECHMWQRIRRILDEEDEDAPHIVPVATGPGTAGLHASDLTGDPIDVNASTTMPVES